MRSTLLFLIVLFIFSCSRKDSFNEKDHIQSITFDTSIADVSELNVKDRKSEGKNKPESIVYNEMVIQTHDTLLTSFYRGPDSVIDANTPFDTGAYFKNIEISEELKDKIVIMHYKRIRALSKKFNKKLNKIDTSDYNGFLRELYKQRIALNGKSIPFNSNLQTLLKESTSSKVNHSLIKQIYDNGSKKHWKVYGLLTFKIDSNGTLIGGGIPGEGDFAPRPILRQDGKVYIESVKNVYAWPGKKESVKALLNPTKGPWKLVGFLSDHEAYWRRYSRGEDILTTHFAYIENKGYSLDDYKNDMLSTNTWLLIEYEPRTYGWIHMDDVALYSGPLLMFAEKAAEFFKYGYAKSLSGYWTRKSTEWPAERSPEFWKKYCDGEMDMCDSVEILSYPPALNISFKRMVITEFGERFYYKDPKQQSSKYFHNICTIISSGDIQIKELAAGIPHINLGGGGRWYTNLLGDAIGGLGVNYVGLSSSDNQRRLRPYFHDDTLYLNVMTSWKDYGYDKSLFHHNTSDVNHCDWYKVSSLPPFEDN